ncbi:phosphoenolpyruvate--protein phosphotransferase [Peribacillus asahii]|uniref:phosphoenolpyruvate--protein phosphotransferase n=1 Tax=Peribacillus asahii TaxID=228899 RepID=UPI0037F26A73
MSTLLSGVAASAGIAIAKAYRLDEPILFVERRTIENSDAEIVRFQEMIHKSRAELKMIRTKVEQHVGDDHAAIFDAHLLILEDPEFLLSIQHKIQTEQINAEFALQETVDMFMMMFEQNDNLLIRERAIDLYDVKMRLLAHLLGVHLPNPSLIAEDVIIIANDLTPSDTARLNPLYVKGFATERGASSSHSAIIARSLNIPAIVGVKEGLAAINHGDMVIIDGFRGQVHINPTSELMKRYESEQIAEQAITSKWDHFVHQPTVTKDGHQITLAANIVSEKEGSSVLFNGAEGVGLFRTEFLFMGRNELPSEEKQFQTYKAILVGMQGKPVVIRTLDVGGDKDVPHLHLPYESNPFLGYRAIRYSLKEPVQFERQLRALLRASVFGHLKIMFPMVTTLTELRTAKMLLNKVKQELLDAGTQVNENIEIGMMVEVPATAIMADVFAKEVDFFSIGTNDLIQYTMAADRLNERVAYLYQPYNPAIFRLIKMVIDAAHNQGKWVGLCGEMAADPIAIPILLGLGVEEFSMNAASILQVRSYIHQLSQTEMRKLAETILHMETAEDVQQFIQQALNDVC